MNPRKSWVDAGNFGYILGIEYPDGSILTSWCSEPGLVSKVGRILLDHYRDPDKVRALISLGQLVYLGEEIGEAHDGSWFDKIDSSLWDVHPLNKITTAFARDVGDDEYPAKLYSSLDDQEFRTCTDGFFYLYRETEQAWYVGEMQYIELPTGEESILPRDIPWFRLSDFTPEQWAKFKKQDDLIG